VKNPHVILYIYVLVNVDFVVEVLLVDVKLAIFPGDFSLIPRLLKLYYVFLIIRCNTYN
jgi:hypothetical protein